MYPADWPACVTCGRPALDGHLTCGDVRCDEARARATRLRSCELLLRDGRVIDLSGLTAEEAFTKLDGLGVGDGDLVWARSYATPVLH